MTKDQTIDEIKKLNPGVNIWEKNGDIYFEFSNPVINFPKKVFIQYGKIVIYDDLKSENIFLGYYLK